MATALAQALRQARAEWPEVRVSDETFAAHLEAAGVQPDDLARFGADLFLACGCAHRDRGALRAFDRRILPAVERHVVRTGLLKRTPRDEISQMIRVWLLADARPRIASYAGRGPLLGWLKIVAARRALKLTLRRRPEPLQLDELTAARLAAGSTAPEVTNVRSRLGSDFQRALDASVTTLSPHARSLLRLHYLEGLNIDAIGLRHGVHRATVARWLAGIRATILARLRDELSTSPRPSSSEFHSLTAAMRDDLHLSLDRLLDSANHRA